MKKIITFILFGLLISCTNEKEIIRTSFNVEESETINKIIDYYYDFIYTQADKNYSMEEAYLFFLNRTIPLTIKSGDLGHLIPKTQDKIDFYSTLNRNNLSEIYKIEDTIVLYSRNLKKRIKIYRPFSFSMNLNGKYIDFLNKLSTRNSFFNDYYNSVMAVGTYSSINYNMFLNDYKKIDFSKKEERLVFIIATLGLQENLPME